MTHHEQDATAVEMKTTTTRRPSETINPLQSSNTVNLSPAQRRTLLTETLLSTPSTTMTGVLLTKEKASDMDRMWTGKFSVKPFLLELLGHFFFYLGGPILAVPVFLLFHTPAWVAAHGFLPLDKMSAAFFFSIEFPSHVLVLLSVINVVWPPNDTDACHFDPSIDIVLPFILLFTRAVVISTKYAFMTTAYRLRGSGDANYYRNTLLTYWAGDSSETSITDGAVAETFPDSGLRALGVHEPTAQLVLQQDRNGNGGQSFMSVWQTSKNSSMSSKKSRSGSRMSYVGKTLEQHDSVFDVTYREIATSLFDAFHNNHSHLTILSTVTAVSALSYLLLVLGTKFIFDELPFNNAKCSGNVGLGALHVLSLLVGMLLSYFLTMFSCILYVDLMRRNFMLGKMDSLIRRLQLRSAIDVVNWMRARDIMTEIGAHHLKRMGSQLVLFALQLVLFAGWILSLVVEVVVQQNGAAGSSNSGSGSNSSSVGNGGKGIFPSVFYPSFGMSLIIQLIIAACIRQGAIANRQCVRQGLHWSKVLGELSIHEFDASQIDPEVEVRRSSLVRRRKCRSAAGLPSDPVESRSIESAIKSVVLQLEHLNTLAEIRLATLPLSWHMFHQFVGLIVSEVVFIVSISSGFLSR